MEAGIVELRKAEEQATSEVEKARALAGGVGARVDGRETDAPTKGRERAARMKLAKQEAEKEIAAYRAELEGKLVQWDKEQKAGEGSLSVEALSSEADKQIQTMQKDVEANWSKVADMLADVVMKVDMKVPDARKGMMKSQ